MSVRRYCQRFYCDRWRERVCCASCREADDCRNRCLNHPSRCRLEDVEKRKRKAAAGTPSAGCADSSLREGAKKRTDCRAGVSTGSQ